jgi:hypothetical protein
MDIFIKELDPINAELIKILEPTQLTPEQLQELKEKAYARHLKNLEYSKKYRDKHRDIYNAKARLKMYNNYYTHPEYREKQKTLYYQKRYGVSTLEEVEQIKAQRSKEEIDKLINKTKELGKSKGLYKQPMNFETFVALKCN